MIELGQILEGLVRRTTEGKLNWSRTVENRRFVTSVDAISVVIEELQYPPDIRYRLDILDESGETVESLRYEDTTSEQDEQLARLYVLARRSALNINATLEKLARGCRQSNLVQIAMAPNLADGQIRKGVLGIPGRHSPPLLELQETVLHQMPQLVQRPVVVPLFLPVALGRYHRIHPPGRGPGHDFIGVIGFVRQQVFRP